MNTTQIIHGDSKSGRSKKLSTKIYELDQAIAASNQSQITGFFQGVIDASGNPNYPVASKDMYWKISVAGKIGGGSGLTVDVGDEVIAIANSIGGTQAAVGTQFMTISGNPAVGDKAELIPVARTNNPTLASDSIYKNLDTLDAAIGADNVPVVRTQSPTVANSTINAKIQALDNAIGSGQGNVVRTNNQISDSNSVDANISLLDAAIGADAVSFAIIANANSVTANLSALDLAVYFLQQAATFNSTSASINGAGANQGAATLVGTGIAVVALADGAVGVRLPIVGTTKVITLFNIVAAQDLLIYPATGEYLNAAAQNASIKFSHATDVSSVVCTYQSAGKWTVTAIHGTIS